MRSLKARLILLLSLGTSLLLVFLSLATHAWVRQVVLRELDQVLLSNAAALVPLVELDHQTGLLEFEDDLEDLPRFLREDTAYVRIVGPSGTVVYSTTTFPDIDIRHSDRPSLFSWEGPPPVRVASETILVSAGGPPARRPPPVSVNIYVARDLSLVNQQLAKVKAVFITISVIGAVLAGLFAWMVVWHGLRPLDRLLGEIRDLNSRSLRSGVSEHGLPTELQAIALQINDSLQRLDDTFKRQRRFTSDVAHELRTPLASIQLEHEIALRGPRTSEEYRTHLSRAMEQLHSLREIVDKLLTLSQLDNREPGEPLDAVAFRPILLRTMERFHDELTPKDLSVTLQVDDPFLCLGDHTLMDMVAVNLIGNAVCYAPDHASIQIIASTENGSHRFLFRNPAPHLTPEHMPLLLEPFQRGDQTAEASGRHLGLGLALVRRAVQWMNGDISLHLTEDQQLEVLVCLPMAATEHGSAVTDGLMGNLIPGEPGSGT